MDVGIALLLIDKKLHDNKLITGLQLLSTEGGNFNDILEQVSNSSGSLQRNFDKISDTSAFKLSSAFNEFKNSLIDIGGAFAPAISGFSEFMSNFAKFVDGLGTGTKTAIGYITGFTALLSPALSGVSKAIKGMNDLGILDKLFTGGKGVEKVSKSLGKTFKIDVNPELNPTTLEKGLGKLKFQKKDIDVPIDIDVAPLKNLNGVATESTGIMSKLFGIIKANPFVALGVAIVGAYTAYKILNAVIKAGNDNYWKHTKAVEEATQAVEKHNKVIAKIKDEKGNVQALAQEYETLSKKTNKSAEDQEKLVKIAKELEKIDPNLVEYDNGNIQVRIDKVEELIKKYDEAIKKEKILANKDYKKGAYNAKGSLSEKYNDKYGHEQSDLIQKRDSLSLKNVNNTDWLGKDNWKDKIAEQRKKLEEYSKIIDEEKSLQDRYTADKKKASNKVKDYLLNTFDVTNVTAGFNDKMKEQYDNMMKTLDFSDFDEEGIERVSSKLKNFFKTASEADMSNADEIVNSVKKITNEFSSGKLNTDDYNAQIDNYIKKYSELTGLSESDAREALKLPEVDASSLLNVTDEIDEAKTKINLALMEIADTSDMDMRIQLAMQIANDESIPQDIRDQVREAIDDDGVIDDEEIKVIMKAVGELDSSDLSSQIDDQLAQEINSIDSENFEIKAGIKIATDVSNVSELNYFMEKLVGKTYATTIQVQIEKGDFEGVAEKLKDLPKEKQVSIVTAMVNSGEYSPEELKTLISNLPDNVITTINTQIQNGNIPKELANDLSEIDGRISVADVKINGEDNVTPKINSINNTSIPPKNTVLNANANPFNSIFNGVQAKQLSPKTGTLKANASPFNSTFSGLQAKQLSPKTGTLKANASPFNSTFSGVQGKKLNDKTSTLKAIDNATSVIRGVNSGLANIKSKSVTVTVTQIFKTIGKKIQGFFGGGQSVGEPHIIELDQPYRINPTQIQSVGNPQILDGLVGAINNTEEVARVSASNIVDIMSTARKKTIKPNINTNQTFDGLEYNIDLLTNMTNILKKIGTQIDILDSKLNRTWGTNSAKLLRNQISLLTKQQNLTKVNIKNMEGMAKKLKGSLAKQGFKFKDDGTISNYNSKLIAMQKNVEKLEKAEKNYKGKSEKKKDKLSKAYEKANDSLEKTKNKLNEYYDLQFSEIPEAQQQWEEYANAIAEAKAEIIRCELEAKTFFKTVKMEMKDSMISRNETWADTFMLKADLSSWSKAVGYIKEANKLLEKNQKHQQSKLETAQDRANDNKAFLKKQGFKFDKNGYVTGAEKTLQKLKKNKSTQEYDAIKEAFDSYVDDMYENIPKAENEWWKLEQEIKENKQQIEETTKSMNDLVKSANLNQLSAKYDRLSDALDMLETKTDLVYGANKKGLIQEQIALLQKMTDESRNLAKENEKLANDYKKDLMKQGIQFDEEGNVTNLEDALNRLKNSGTLDDMEKLQDLVDNYNDSLSDISNANGNILENQKNINNLKDSLIELNDEMKELQRNAWTKELENDMKILDNQLEEIEARRELNGANQVELMKEQVSLYVKQKQQLQNSLDFQRNISKEMARELKSYGFTINDNGTIDGTVNKLEQLKNTLSDTEFDHVNNLLEDYFDTALDTIPELNKQYLELQKNIESLEKDKLNTTKDVEDEITKILEKQVEKRKDKIQEEADERVKVLENARKEYQKWRDDVDYKDDYEEQLKTVEELQKKIEVVKRDDSLSGKKKLASLMDELKEEQKNLEDLVQNKIDDDIGNGFDDQIDKIQKDSEDEIKKLEELWSETNIAKAVQESLKSGIFKDIDGNVSSLKSAMIDMTNTSVEYMGILGDSMRTELLSSLNVALDTVQKIDKTMSKINYNSAMYAGIGYNSEALQGNVVNNNDNSNVINVDFNYQITAQAGATVDEDAIKSALSQSKKEITAELENKILKYVK